MRYVDEYRAPEQVMQLVAHLQQRARLLPHTAARPLRIMEVCGGHTHAIFKFGLDQLLPENIEFIHGPGCPVCVLPMGRIDACIEIASRPGVIFCTFGDAHARRGFNETAQMLNLCTINLTLYAVQALRIFRSRIPLTIRQSFALTSQPT